MNDLKGKNQTITKWNLFERSVRSIVLSSIVFGVLLTILFLIIIFFVSEHLTWKEALTVSFGSGLTTSLFMIIICVINPIAGLYRLFRQENALKFSFVNEMQKSNIVDTNFENEKWFINTKNVMITVINRDYILEIKKIEKRKMQTIVTLIRFDGRKLKISGSHETILKFKNWFLLRL